MAKSLFFTSDISDVASMGVNEIRALLPTQVRYLRVNAESVVISPITNIQILIF